MPSRFGAPCWDVENVDRAISRIAQVDASQTEYFLACHDPIDGLVDIQGREITEDEFFSDLFQKSYAETLAFVYGGPGTGKSHLIRWLQIRTEDAKEKSEISISGADDLNVVLVRRRTGTLKDALEQIIRQLPDQFESYLDPVNQAIDKISDENAREKLALTIFDELGDRWEHRGLPEVDQRQVIREICTDKGYRTWLCRYGGAIDQIVGSLRESRVTEGEDEELIFRDDDLLIGDQRYAAQLSPQLQELKDDFEDDPQFRASALNALNTALPFAVKELIGLGDSGTRLRDIFDSIRRDLKESNKALAIYIEDVSVMSALDEEVVNAFEPQENPDLCSMFAVLGMTDAGYNRLPDNMKQRATHIVGFVDQSAGIFSSSKRVAQMSARYLNAVRLSAAEVAEISVARKNGTEIPISACASCEKREICHSTFGRVKIGDVDIGMFPFSPEAPLQLVHRFANLERSRFGYTPRTLLDQVIRSVLVDGEALEENLFPRSLSLLSSAPPTYWDSFRQNYCGGWSREDVRRLRLLAESWISASSDDEAATKIRGYLEPLGFQEFSKEAAEAPKPEPEDDDTNGKDDEIDHGPEAPPEELVRFLADISTWEEDETKTLRQARLARELVAAVLKNSIDWENYQRLIPVNEVNRLSRSFNYGVVDIEGMDARIQAGRFSIKISRSTETRELLAALSRRRFLGSNSWNYTESTSDKRTIARWVRRNGKNIVQQLTPLDVEENRSEAIRSAISALCLIYKLGHRKALPSDLTSILNCLMEPPPEVLPRAVTDQMERELGSLSNSHASITKLLVEETGIRQGIGDPIFLDGGLLVSILQQIDSADKLEKPSEAIFEGSTGPRFDGLREFNWDHISSHLEVESSEFFEQLEAAKGLLEEWDCGADGVAEGARNFIKKAVELRIAAIESMGGVPHEAFDQICEDPSLEQTIDVLAEALDAVSEDYLDPKKTVVLLHDPALCIQATEVIATTSAFLKSVESEVTNLFAGVGVKGSGELIGKVKDGLSFICTYIAEPEKNE